MDDATMLADSKTNVYTVVNLNDVV